MVIFFLYKKVMRIEVEAGINGCVLITDSYESDLKYLTQHSLTFLEQQTDKSMPRILILSDSDDTDFMAVCNNVNKAVSDELLQEVVFIGENFLLYEKLFSVKNKEIYKTLADFLVSDFFQKVSNKAILVKMSSKYDSALLLNRLRLLVHDTVLEIDFNALHKNVSYFRSKLLPDTKLMCMVKASAYGSGSVEVSRALQYWNCDYLAVAFVDEGVELRQEGIRIPILVLDPSVEALERIVEYDLEPEIYSFRVLQAMQDVLLRLKKKNYPIHIKIDTGMHRAGFEESDITKLISLLKNTSEIKVVSVFSHLVGSDDELFDDFTKNQIADFRTCAEYIEEQIGYPILKHILNSSGIERFSLYQFDMVRLGIGLWGVTCFDNQLKNVCSLKTRISQIRTVKKGETIGYSRNGVLFRDSKIALLPLGYADGIDRRLGNGVLSVLINGKSYPTIGNICMDLMMVDVTDAVGVEEGCEVTVFGDTQSLSEVAKLLGTIPYEVLTSVAPRVRRVYFDE